MRRIILSAGHSNVIGKDMGASGNGYIEGVLAVEFVQLLEQELKLLKVPVVVDKYSNTLVETLASLKSLITKTDITIEIHWNASINDKASGVEVLVPGRTKEEKPSSFESQLSQDTCKVFSRALSIKDRGVKSESESARKTLGWMRLNCENNLVEVCFISNKDDMSKYEANKMTLIREYAKLLQKYSLL